jgi:hypothetical protein
MVSGGEGIPPPPGLSPAVGRLTATKKGESPSPLRRGLSRRSGVWQLLRKLHQCPPRCSCKTILRRGKPAGAAFVGLALVAARQRAGGAGPPGQPLVALLVTRAGKSRNS